MTLSTLVPRRHALPAVAHRWYWIAAGLAAQALGIGILGAWAYSRYEHVATPDLAVRASVMLVWDQTVHSRAGLAVCATAAVVFAVGCVLAARPFARTWELLLVVVPLAAIAGVIALGALVVVAVVGYVVLMLLDGLNGVGSGSEREKPEVAARPPTRSTI